MPIVCKHWPVRNHSLQSAHRSWSLRIRPAKTSLSSLAGAHILSPTILFRSLTVVLFKSSSSWNMLPVEGLIFTLMVSLMLAQQNFQCNSAECTICRSLLRQYRYHLNEKIRYIYIYIYYLCKKVRGRKTRGRGRYTSLESSSWFPLRTWKRKCQTRERKPQMGMTKALLSEPLEWDTQ